MSENTPQPISYNKRTPREIMMFTEFICEVYSEIEKPKWSNDSHAEIGFYEKNKTTGSNIFFGIWYEAWEFFGIPLCITLDYGGNSVTDKYNQIRKHIESKNEAGLYYKEFQDFALILFDHEFFNFKNDTDRLVTMYTELRNLVDIKTFSK